MDYTQISKKLVDKIRFRQRIVICGSMSFYGEMVNYKRMLEKYGIPALVPKYEDFYVASFTKKEFEAFKKTVSFGYLKHIRRLETVAILAVNRDKYGIPDYIGPNTFAEIAVAFAQGKKIFLLQGIPEVYASELDAWGVIPLNGRISYLLEYYRAVTSIQLRLFEDI